MSSVTGPVAATITELIGATADGAGRGVSALRNAGVGVGLEDFAVEVRLDGGPDALALSASVLITLVVAEAPLASLPVPG